MKRMVGTVLTIIVIVMVAALSQDGRGATIEAVDINISNDLLDPASIGGEHYHKLVLEAKAPDVFRMELKPFLTTEPVNTQVSSTGSSAVSDPNSGIRESGMDIAFSEGESKPVDRYEIELQPGWSCQSQENVFEVGHSQLEFDVPSSACQEAVDTDLAPENRAELTGYEFYESEEPINKNPEGLNAADTVVAPEHIQESLGGAMQGTSFAVNRFAPVFEPSLAEVHTASLLAGHFGHR